MKVVLGVSGGIAAYKAPDIVRRLQDIGADVRVILTANAARFVSPLSLSAVSGHGVMIEQWGDPASGGVDHVELARWADILLIAPATANILAKLSVGIADDALTTYALAHHGPLLVAPSMNTWMLGHPTVAANIETLRSRGAMIIEPASGLLACGDEGAGRLPDPPAIAERVKLVFAALDLHGRRVLVTAGPTREALDPVRYITNRSSGRMGYAIAEAARSRGAIVTLVTGPTSLAVPPNVEVVPVMSAREMYDAVLAHLNGSDVVVKAAAVSDFTPETVSPKKIKKEAARDLTVKLTRTPDILEAIGRMAHRPLVVAFAAETHTVEKNAREKLERKNADVIVANDVSDPTIGFDSENNAVTIITKSGDVARVEKAPKLAIANRILDVVAERLKAAARPA